ncbi:MAG: F0F1 ATP synthase subunit B', partial [Hyphomicrobiales bacterium]
MPQLEISTYVPQLVWLAITFCLLYLVMARIALPRLGGIIERRRDRIATYLDEAETLRQNAEESHQSRRSLLSQSRLEA